MPVNPDLVGRTYPPAEPYSVGREAIRDFARAVQAAHPAHHDVEAARSLGHPDLVAPPTFAIVVAQRADAALIADPEAGIDFSAWSTPTSVSPTTARSSPGTSSWPSCTSTRSGPWAPGRW